MNSNQIMQCLTREKFTRDSFRGVFPRDLLAKRGHVLKNKNNSFVCNTANQNNSGEHWIAMYFDCEGKGEYFDSYGFAPNSDFAEFLDVNSQEWTFNTTPLQSPLTTVCGQYCIFWLICKGKAYNSDYVIDSLKCIDGDRHVLNFVNKHFSGVAKSELVNRRFMIDQISKSLHGK